MRFIIGLCSIVLFGCQPDNDDELLTTERLAGTYILTLVQPDVERQPMLFQRDSVVLAYVNELAYSLFALSEAGTGYQLRNGRLTVGRYALKGTELTLRQTRFRRLKLRRQSLTMNESRQLNGKSVVLRYVAYRLNLGTDKLRFEALARAAFTHPTHPETDAQIRTRVKNSLYFYALFFRTVYTNQLNQFKPAAISLPIRFYNGGIRVQKAIDSTATWTQMYANAADAVKAHDLYWKAAKAIKKYPNHGNFIQEYAIVMQQMADAI